MRGFILASMRLRVAGWLVALVFTVSPVLAVVCGFVCQPEAVTAGAAPSCHGEQHEEPASGTALTSRNGCDHDLAPVLLTQQNARLVVVPAAILDSMASLIRAGTPGKPAPFEYPPGAVPGAFAARSLVLRI